jgi:hypothetical protein
MRKSGQLAASGFPFSRRKLQNSVVLAPFEYFRDCVAEILLALDNKIWSHAASADDGGALVAISRPSFWKAVVDHVIALDAERAFLAARSPSSQLMA